ncbi:hypothetical protein [Streptomyces sp. NPDC050504]|uniref:hypothetical protein n=1 Tax=Streptomyces sp. NPDC050504 TaxID=3365618 RepID=UPI0037A5CE14
MSQPYPPQPGNGQNPYGAPGHGQPQGGYGAPQGGYGQPQGGYPPQGGYGPGPGGYGPGPFPPQPQGNVGLGLLAAFVTALVAGAVYGGIAGAIDKEIGWAAIGVGFVTGLVAAKVGGRNAALGVVSALFSAGAVYLGQLIAIAVIISDRFGVSFSKVFFDHFDTLPKVWKEDADAMTWLFFALAAVAAFSGSRKLNQ